MAYKTIYTYMENLDCKLRFEINEWDEMKMSKSLFLELILFVRSKSSQNEKAEKRRCSTIRKLSSTLNQTVHTNDVPLLNFQTDIFQTYYW